MRYLIPLGANREVSTGDLRGDAKVLKWFLLGLIMKIVKVPGINALGKGGSEVAPDLVLGELTTQCAHPNAPSQSSVAPTLDEKLVSSNKVKAKSMVEEVVVDNSNVEESQKSIYEKSKELFESGERVVFLGGDHSISYPILKGFGEVYGFDESFLIVFDAHADCMAPMKEPTHEEWLRGIVELGWRGENVVIIGCRKIEGVEKKFLAEHGVKCYSDGNWELIVDGIMERARGKNVYVSVDIDVFEPCVAPGVHYPEPCGLESKEFFYLLRRFLYLNVRGVDIVEIVPSIDEKYDFRSVKVGKKILEEVLGKIGRK